MAAGNNCPGYGGEGVCLRGQKGRLYEGGVRNNAMLCSKTLVPDAMKGKSYSKGLVHITDWHATLRDLAGASDSGSKTVDGKNVFDAITQNVDSPRTEFLVNIDPCSGHGACTGTESAYRFTGCVGSACGDWKFLHTTEPVGWFPVPTEYQCSGHGGCEDPSAFSGQGSPSSFVASASDSGDLLFDLSKDPNEEENVADQYPDVLAELRNRVLAIENGDDFLAACNVPGGSCSAQDTTAFAVFAEHGNAWFPWAADPSTISVV